MDPRQNYTVWGKNSEKSPAFKTREPERNLCELKSGEIQFLSLPSPLLSQQCPQGMVSLRAALHSGGHRHLRPQEKTLLSGQGNWEKESPLLFIEGGPSHVEWHRLLQPWELCLSSQRSREKGCWEPESVGKILEKIPNSVLNWPKS